MKIERKKHREWTARLSDYLSGELPEADKLAVEAHLSVCDDCNTALSDLVRIVDEADELGEIEPPRDLWPDIAEAIRSQSPSELRGDDPQVIPLPGSRRRVSAARPERIELSRRGLIAASVVLVALSASATWWAGRTSEPIAQNPTGLAPTGAVSPAAAGTAPPEGMAGELAILADVMASASSVLDPNTVRVLERNLGVIEGAIADSREALLQDPGNAFLVQHLERMYRRKLVYLQDAVRLVEFGG